MPCNVAHKNTQIRVELAPASPTEAPTAETTTPPPLASPFPFPFLLTFLFFPNKGSLVFQFFLCLFGAHRWSWEVFCPAGVSICTAFSIRAESSQVKDTQASSDVAFGAEGSQFTISPIVVFAGWQASLFADVLIEAVVAVGTIS